MVDSKVDISKVDDFKPLLVKKYTWLQWPCFRSGCVVLIKRGSGSEFIGTLFNGAGCIPGGLYTMREGRHHLIPLKGTFEYLAVCGEYLYATQRDRIAIIDLSSMNIVTTITHDGFQYLTHILVTYDRIYVADAKQKIVFVFNKATHEPIDVMACDSDKAIGPMAYDSDTLIISSWKAASNEVFIDVRSSLGHYKYRIDGELCFNDINYLSVDNGVITFNMHGILLTEASPINAVPYYPPVFSQYISVRGVASNPPYKPPALTRLGFSFL